MSVRETDIEADLTRLRAAFRTYRFRYRSLPGSGEVEALERKLSRHTIRLEFLQKNLEEIAAEIERLHTEVDGYHKGLVLALEHALARTADEYREGWLPTSIPGYRLWRIEGNSLAGAVMPWSGPLMEATCADHPSDRDDLPHTGGQCGSFGHGCGVYAAKDVRALLHEHVDDTARDFAAGVVALSGKVVEHEMGYRAATARVVAIATVADRIRFSDDTDSIDRLFTALDASPLVDAGPTGPGTIERLAQILIDYTERTIR